MAKKKHISAVISLKDNFSAGLRGIKREQKSFQKEVNQTRKAIDSFNKKKMNARLNATQAHKAFAKLKKDARYIEARKKLVQAVVLKDQATEKLKKIQSTMKNIGNSVAKPVVAAKDKATSVVKGLGSKLAMLTKGVAIPLTIIAAGAGMALSSGMALEQQQISMNHFMGVGNQGKSGAEVKSMSDKYLNDLRNNANATPFETGEVIQAGTRALQIAGGNSKDAMGLVKLAEDMAALNPTKTVGDAMEALADMDMGEYARLTEFGVKGSKEKGDTPESIQKELEKMYTGGAEKLSTSGAGLLSTITGKLKSNISDMGIAMLEPLKPLMTDIISFVEASTPGMLALGEAISGGLATGIGWIKEQMPALAPLFSSAFTTIQSVISTVVPIVGQAFQALSPIFQALLPVGIAVFDGIKNAVQVVAPIVSNCITTLTPVFKNVGSALKSLGTIFASVFNGIMNIVEKTYNFVKPLIDGIGGVVSGVSGAISNGLGWIADKVSGKKKNATGTKYFSGGVSLVGEFGPELVQMPSGSKVYTNTETNSILNSKGRSNASTGANMSSFSVTIAKLAETIIVREDADIDKIANAIVNKIDQRRAAYGG